MLAKLAARVKRPPRLLVVSRVLPRPDQSGGELRLFLLLRLLARRHRVVFYPLVQPGDHGDDARHCAMLRDAGVRILRGAWLFGLELALTGRVYDAVVFEFWECAELGADLVRRHQPWARIIVDSVDVHFRRDEDALSLGISDPATVEASKRRELAVYRRAHAVICISEEDGRLLDAEGGIGCRITIPLVVPERPRSAGRRGSDLLFLGGFNHAPNLDGLLWFAREIWQAIRIAVPDARLTIVGSNPTAAVEELAGVGGIEVLGYVPEIAPELDRAALMVAPLRYGSGMKTKVVEAMAASLAVVTTPVGAQGLDVVSGEHLMIADGPGEFAGRVIELLGDPGRAERIGRAGREYVAGRFFPEAIASRLRQAMASVVDGPRPTIPTGKWLASSARSFPQRSRSYLRRILDSIHGIDYD